MVGIFLLNIPQQIYWTGKTYKINEYVLEKVTPKKNWIEPPIRGLEITLNRIQNRKDSLSADESSESWFLY